MFFMTLFWSFTKKCFLPLLVFFWKKSTKFPFVAKKSVFNLCFCIFLGENGFCCFLLSHYDFVFSKKNFWLISSVFFFCLFLCNVSPLFFSLCSLCVFFSFLLFFFFFKKIFENMFSCSIFLPSS